VVDAIADEGADAVRTTLVYDQVVQMMACPVEGRPNDVLVQDTSWLGYEQIPQSTLFSEIDDQVGGEVDLVHNVCSHTLPRRSVRA
jgi:diaminopropionate ammonia-lyase